MAEPQQAPDPRDRALEELKKKLVTHREAEARVKNLREEVKTVKKEYDKTEDDLKALQSVGQIIGEVLRQLDEERCEQGRGEMATGAGCFCCRRYQHSAAAAATACCFCLLALNHCVMHLVHALLPTYAGFAALQ